LDNDDSDGMSARHIVVAAWHIAVVVDIAVDIVADIAVVGSYMILIVFYLMVLLTWL
jgi:hypothetical protein